MISTHQTKINTFTDKDLEVSQNSRFANENARKKDCGFFGYTLGSPVSEPKKHPSNVGRCLLYRVLGQVRLASVQKLMDDRI
jgi:hypothetical protein